MRYVWFSLGFFLIHLGSYVVAGVLTQLWSKDLYHGPDALFRPLLRDVSEDAERQRQGMLMVPAQLVRALLMSMVLYPLLGALGDLTYPVRFLVLGGLMLIYADLASASAFPNTIEGLVYLRERFVTASAFWRVQSEAVIYSVLFGSVAAWLLF
ncbi:MAG: hypothetical protein WD638_10445 [Nitriliruptoraceae bacterium]